MFWECFFWLCEWNFKGTFHFIALQTLWEHNFDMFSEHSETVNITRGMFVYDFESTLPEH